MIVVGLPVIAKSGDATLSACPAESDPPKLPSPLCANVARLHTREGIGRGQ
jgi:hypothetical protein